MSDMRLRNSVIERKGRALLLGLAGLAACEGDTMNSRSSIHSAEETCARLSTCQPSPFGRSSFGQCVYAMGWMDLAKIRQSAMSNLGPSIATYECVRSATQCEAMQACSKPTPELLALCDATDKDVCSGNRLVLCSHKNWAEGVNFLDCDRAGQVCGVGAKGAWCGVGACDPATTPARCDGNTLLTCSAQGNVLNSEDCAASGRVCAARTNGGAACVGSVACDPFSMDMFCDGTTMVSCMDGTQERSDCADFGEEWTCEASETPTWQSINCVPVAKDCTIGVGETCSGTVIHFCRMGRPATFDCASAGLGGCATATATMTVTTTDTTTDTATTTTAGCVK